MRKWVIIMIGSFLTIMVVLFILLKFNIPFFSFKDDLVTFDKSLYKIKGFDISHHKEIFSWNATKKDNRFCIMKATQGNYFPDPEFYNNWDQSHKMKLTSGAYHYFMPKISAEKQFEYYKNRVKLRPNDLPPILDVEEPGTNMLEVNKWLTLAEKYYGVKPIIYSGYIYFHDNMNGKVNNYPVWLSYKVINNKIPKLKYNQFLFLQYNNPGKVNGIEGKVDLDVFLGDEEKFKQILVK
jgi:lysozyme